MMQELTRKLRLIVARAVINLVNDANGLQLLQVSALADETHDGVERVQKLWHDVGTAGGCDRRTGGGGR